MPLLLSSPGWGQAGVFPPGPSGLWLPPAQGLPEPSPPTHLLTSTTTARPPNPRRPSLTDGEGSTAWHSPLFSVLLNLAAGEVGGRAASCVVTFRSPP